MKQTKTLLIVSAILTVATLLYANEDNEARKPITKEEKTITQHPQNLALEESR